MISLLNKDLYIESDAFISLPVQAQEYIKNILTFKYAKVAGWSWCDIKWEFEPKLGCVKLCMAMTITSKTLSDSVSVHHESRARTNSKIFLNFAATQ
jgi:hypothetical protein